MSDRTEVALERRVVVVQHWDRPCLVLPKALTTWKEDSRRIGIRTPSITRLYPWMNGNSALEVRLSLEIILAAVVLPALYLFYRDRRRIQPGHCPHCGYNLTGNTSGVCSECGEPAAVLHVNSNR